MAKAHAKHAHKGSHKTRRKSLLNGNIDNLEIYAFWTGFASTIISLIGVVVQAFR
jgi:hypothetical protein